MKEDYKLNNIEYNRLSTNIKFIFNILYSVLILCSFIEICLFPSVDAIICIIISILGLSIIKFFHFSINNLLYYPVSTIAITLYVLFFLVLPMPATLLETKPLIYNLHNPVETFSNIFLLECVLVLTHNIYKNIFGKRNLIRNILIKLPVYYKLTSSELWFLIIISSCIHIYIIMSQGLYLSESENVYSNLPLWLYLLNLLYGGFHPLIFLFLFRKFSIIKNENYKIYYIPILLISTLLFLVGIATNMRTAAIQTLSVAFFLFIYYWIYYLSKKSLDKKIIFFCIFLIWFFSGPFINISRAMVDVRSERSGLNGFEMLKKTFTSTSNIKLEKNKNKKVSNFYSEDYLDNDILQRFCSVKIHDETIYRAHQLGFADKRMQEHLKNTIKSYIPGNIQNKLGIKVTAFEGSLTDKLAYLSHSTSMLGGVKIGTLQGLGLAIYGWWYIPIIIGIYIIIFYLMDSLLYYHQGEMRFSWIFLCYCVTFCYWFSDRHYYVWEYRFLMRGFLEMVLFTNIAIFLIKKLPFIKH